VTVLPEIRYTQIDYMTDEFIVIGCDGMYDVMKNWEIVDFVREKLSDHKISE